MATIVLSSLGSLFGPIGQMIGAFAGNVIDNTLFGPEDREGARLKELAVTGSSYGTPIAKHYGTMRVPGTIIWATDLQEHREKQSNGKGAPKTITYSYTVSFAVALSSRPIEGIGRIWADGNLLRGARGDLKSAGKLRIHKGHGAQARDPLIEAALGAHCPAFRGCAYVVFEDLDLTDFGNRIPALSFEVHASPASTLIEDMLAEQGLAATPDTRFNELVGFSHEGGSLRDVAQLVDQLHPLAPSASGEQLVFSAPPGDASTITTLPQAAAWEEGDFGKQGGFAAVRSDTRAKAFASLRYYDPLREYQPGLQHAENSNAGTRTFQFPGALSAGDALALARRANQRTATACDTLLWRSSELDPAVGPGSLVRIPDRAGIWQVASWELRERGVELELVRHRTGRGSDIVADPGSAWTPPDRLASQTYLRVFEIPSNGSGSSGTRTLFAAVDAPVGRWSGAALYAERFGALSALGLSATERGVTGTLAAPLAASSAIRFEAEASLVLELLNRDAQVFSTTLDALAQGENKLLVGDEIIQFLSATPLGQGVWRLGGLLRGRGATEVEARQGHPVDTPCTLLDERLVSLGENALAGSTETFAAIGVADAQPATALLENPRVSLRPPEPVHCRRFDAANGSVALRWQRRARGQWLWLDEVPPPLVEESEAYEVGYGPVGTPFATWETDVAGMTLDPANMDALVATYGHHDFWVRQLGSYAKSRPSLLQPLAR